MHFPPSATIHLWKKLDFAFCVILLSPLAGNLITNRKKKNVIIKDNNHERKIYCQTAADQAEGRGQTFAWQWGKQGSRLPSLAPDASKQCLTAQALDGDQLWARLATGDEGQGWMMAAEEEEGMPTSSAVLPPPRGQHPPWRCSGPSPFVPHWHGVSRGLKHNTP